uniref:Uncharacterized protein n=1 Tax=Anguilla anguilla TaxID=7936 RepID=A0A0E9VNG3_ANGAN
MQMQSQMPQKVVGERGFDYKLTKAKTQHENLCSPC